MCITISHQKSWYVHNLWQLTLVHRSHKRNRPRCMVSEYLRKLWFGTKGYHCWSSSEEHNHEVVVGSLPCGYVIDIFNYLMKWHFIKGTRLFSYNHLKSNTKLRRYHHFRPIDENGLCIYVWVNKMTNNLPASFVTVL